MSGWNITSEMIDNLYDYAIDFINKNSDVDIFSASLNSVIYQKKVDIKLIETTINEIYHQSKHIFGECNNLFDTLKIIDLKNNDFYFGDFQYLPPSVDLDDNGACILFSSNSSIDSLELLKLKIVHEVYPGHHYSYSHKNESLLNKITKN